MMRMVSLISGRGFVGYPLNRNLEYRNALINFSGDVLEAARRVREASYIGKTLQVYFGADVRKVYGLLRQIRQIIVPELKARRVTQTLKPDAPKPVDMIQWVMESVREDARLGYSFETQSDIQMWIGMAGMETTAVALTDCLYDLMVNQEYFEPLRQEIDAMWEETKGDFTHNALTKMIKLDSFVRESQRWNAHSLSKPQLVGDVVD